MANKKTILITGVGGFLGSHVCERFVNAGYSVVGLYHSTKEKARHLEYKKNFKLAKVDIANARSVSNIVKRIQPAGVVHVAALHSPKPIESVQSFFKANVQGTLNLLEACRLHGVKTFVYSSSMSIYGTGVTELPVRETHPARPYDFYSFTKLLGEQSCEFYAKTHSINVVVLRYVGAYGLRRYWGALANFTSNALQDAPIKIDNNINWDIVSAPDIARANEQAFKKAGTLGFEIINIGSGKEVNIKELAEKIIRISKSASNIVCGTKLAKNPASHFYFDIAKAKRLLGFKPTPLDKGLQQYIGELKKYNV
ncbi:MAG: SDR family NAD(P)-dependent oxidoreductase [Parcubacteria group bacterium]|nr:SDR family NAD(P)-dependent oxidoreductase [Parcubacteria group bacterium]